MPRCFYDNAKTHMREVWVDGEVVARHSRDDVKNDNVRPRLPNGAHTRYWVDGQVVGDIQAMKRVGITRTVQVAKTHRVVLSPSEIKAIRAQANLSQLGLANTLDVSPKCIDRWERGEVSITYLQSEGIKRIFDL